MCVYANVYKASIDFAQNDRFVKFTHFLSLKMKLKTKHNTAKTIPAVARIQYVTVTAGWMVAVALTGMPS